MLFSLRLQTGPGLGKSGTRKAIKLQMSEISLRPLTVRQQKANAVVREVRSWWLGESGSEWKQKVTSCEFRVFPSRTSDVIPMGDTLSKIQFKAILEHVWGLLVKFSWKRFY